MIYLDNAGTTKPYSFALEKASIFNEELFFNPSALYHGGLEVKKRLEEIRENVISCFSEDFDLIFTSCGSESDNMAINSYLKRGNAVTTLGEHSAVHNTFMEYKNKGYDTKFATLNENGSVNVENLLSLIDKNTVFVSVVHVNNETGALNDINYIAEKVKEINPRIVFHSDGVQAFLKVPFVPSNKIDLYSVSAHKLNALKGVGGIFRNKKLTTFKPLIIGGGQENGYRSGTENTFGLKVFEICALDHFKTINEDYKKVCELKEKFLSIIDKDIFKVISTGKCSPYVISLSAIGLKGEVIQHKLEQDDIVIGTGSACSSKHKHSRMLTTIGYDNSILDGVLRVSFNCKSTMEEAILVAEKLNLRAKELKKVMELV